MIYYLLDAYDSEIKNIMNRKIRNLEFYEKFLLGIIILGGVIAAVGLFIPYQVLKTIISFSYFVIVMCCTYILNRVHKKRYSEYMQNYNEKLNKINEILNRNEVRINTAPKIQHLILQYETVIQEHKESQHIFSSTKGYCYVVILPIVIYLVQHTIDVISAEQAIQFTISLVGVLIIILVLFMTVYLNVEPVINRKMYNMKYFKEELKDLYRRDYLE